MKERYGKAEIHVWTPLIGFDKDKRDRGAGAMLERMPFTPDGVSLFLFHMDSIMQHEGMETEKTLPPDMCSYAATSRNGQRERQEWTSYGVRDLVSELSAAGTETYLSIMANPMENRFHDEWIYQHSEVIYDARTEKGALNVMRRMSDGSYFEDLFIEKLCTTLTDYGFAGFMPTDLFCPMCLRISMGDYSSDMLEQFAEHTGITLPKEIRAGLGDDSVPNKCMRGDWLWKEQREAWIRFYAWRWGEFWKKVCSRLHAIGKKVISLGIYCTDPFENLYCMGIDLKMMAEAGVDAFMPNPVGTGLRLQHPDWRDPFYQYMNILPLLSAYVPDQKLLSMLGVRDDTEEWDLLHHAPCNLERDIYMQTGFMRITKQGMKRCIDGFVTCLGDSLRTEDWQWLKERFDVGFCDQAEESASPVLLWSDAAFHAMLPAYIKTRRWTVHKYAYEMEKHGTLLGAAARTEDLEAVSGVLFVPNFDLLSDEEKKAVAAYKRGAVVCTATADFRPEEWGIEPDIFFTDAYSSQPACAFAFGTQLSDETCGQIDALCAEDDGTENFEGEPADMPEYDCTVLRETLRFSKVTEGFCRALALLLRSTGTEAVTCSLPIKVTRLRSGQYRLAILNPSLLHYGYAVVSCQRPLRAVDNVSLYPVLPVKFLHAADQKPLGFMENASDGTQRHFRVKVAPGGMTILQLSF